MNAFRKIISPWVIIGAILIGLLLVAGAFAVLDYTRPQPAQPGIPTAEIAMISAPTSTPVITAAPPQTPTPTADIPPAPIPGVLSPGAIVQIVGTGGEGLNLRAIPGLQSNIQYLGFESEVFTIVEGPVEKDGFVWWRLVGFYDETRSGWGASNFLEIVQTP